MVFATRFYLLHARLNLQAGKWSQAHLYLCRALGTARKARLGRVQGQCLQALAHLKALLPPVAA
jgi:hypothetical protein